MAYNRDRILERDNYRCRYCGWRAPIQHLQIDHVQPRSLGGTDHHLNLVTCKPCNALKGATEPAWTPCTDPLTNTLDRYPTGWDPRVLSIGLDAYFGDEGAGSIPCLDVR